MTKKKKRLIQQGTCPVCGGLRLNYGDTSLESESLGYEWDCPDCDSSGVEWHSLTFSMHVTRSVKGIPKIKSFDPDR